MRQRSVGHRAPRARDRLGDEELALPLLHVPDDADDRRVVGDAELAADRGAAAGDEAAGSMPS